MISTIKHDVMQDKARDWCVQDKVRAAPAKLHCDRNSRSSQVELYLSIYDLGNHISYLLRTNIPWRGTALPPCPAQSTLGAMAREEACLGCWGVIETGGMIGEEGAVLLHTVIRATHQLPSTTTTARALLTTTMTHTTPIISASTGRIRTECLRAAWVMVGMTEGTPLLPVKAKGIIILFLVTKSCILEEQSACLQPYLG